jgi:hypothetical protein
MARAEPGSTQQYLEILTGVGKSVTTIDEHGHEAVRQVRIENRGQFDIEVAQQSGVDRAVFSDGGRQPADQLSLNI